MGLRKVEAAIELPFFGAGNKDDIHQLRRRGDGELTEGWEKGATDLKKKHDKFTDYNLLLQ
jgi:hypothetical protein